MNPVLMVWSLLSFSGKHWQIATLLLDELDHLKSLFYFFFGGRSKVAVNLGQESLHADSGPLHSRPLQKRVRPGFLLLLDGPGPG